MAPARICDVCGNAAVLEVPSLSRDVGSLPPRWARLFVSDGKEGAAAPSKDVCSADCMVKAAWKFAKDLGMTQAEVQPS